MKLKFRITEISHHGHCFDDKIPSESLVSVKAEKPYKSELTDQHYGNESIHFYVHDPAMFGKFKIGDAVTVTID
jgi:hypothetical protein